LATTVTIGNYNRQVSATDSTVQPLNTCTPTTTDRTGLPYQVKYDVTSVVSDSASPIPSIGTITVSNINALGGYPTGEYSQVLISPINASNKITFTLGNKTYLCPSNYPFPANPSNSQCTNGSPDSREPIWSATYVACPSGFTVPSNP
jgi:hypothetical protein